MDSVESPVATQESALTIVNIAAYRFVTLDRLDERRETLNGLCTRLHLKGTILLSHEGINLFVAGLRVEIDEFLQTLGADPLLADLSVKESLSDQQPFSRMLVKVKQEIIAFGIDGVDPRESTSPKLPPTELKRWLDEGRRIHLLDTRNDYEVELGTFHDAIPAGIDNFREFPQAVSRLPESMKDEPVVMFCTGGIRCEKAGAFMEQAGFRSIFQLDGGILKYFEECGQVHYDGDCFVFDQRVAVDAELRETGAALCFACQMPVTEQQQASPQYVPGESCPHCHRTPEQQLVDRLTERNASIRSFVDPLPGSVPRENRRPLNIPGRFHSWAALDCLAEWHSHYTRDEWRNLLLAGRVVRRNPDRRHSESAVEPGDSVHGGERLDFLEPAFVEPDVKSDIVVLFEDESIVVVNKPAPLPTHACGRFARNTLEYILNEVYRPEIMRAGHRLDANTSGVLLLSRSRRIARLVQSQFENRTVEKVYLAKVHGHPESDEFQCTASIGANPDDHRLRVIDESGQTAETGFQVIRRDVDTTLLEVRPVTGRTNQIRVHLWHLGLPVVGDPAYLPGGVLGENRSIECHEPPLCLQSHALTLLHPESGESVRFEAPAPVWSGADVCEPLQDA